jgi:hypothetical protein
LTPFQLQSDTVLAASTRVRKKQKYLKEEHGKR